jgi:hypothetical protein
MENQPYHLTPEELIFLLGLLEIQPLPGTILADWLTSINYDLLPKGDTPSPARTLIEKGWIWLADQVWHMDDQLARALELTARATTNVIFHLQEEGRVIGRRYAQYQDKCCRYSLAADHFSLDPPQTVQEVTPTLLPEGFQPAGKLQFREELDLASLFVLIEACWQSARAGFLEQEDLSFTMEDLISGLDYSLVEPAAQSWLGLELEVDLEKLPLHTIIQDFINRDLLRHVPGGRLQLTGKSDPFNMIISDPQLLSLACSFHNQQTAELKMASWLLGAGEMLQIELVDQGKNQVSTLFSTQIAGEWIQEAWKVFKNVEPPPALDNAPPAPKGSRKIKSPDQGRSRPPRFTRFLTGLAGTVLSALVIGLLSSTIIGMIQGDLEVGQIASELTAGIDSLTKNVGYSDLRPDDASTEEESKSQEGDAGALTAEEQPSDEAVNENSQEELQTALSQVMVQESRLAQDEYEDWYALGILHNEGQLALSAVKLEIQVLDANGTVLYSENGTASAPLLPGKQTSFAIYLYDWEGGKDNLNLQVTVLDAKPFPVDRAVDIKLSKLQILPTGWDDSYVTVLGEMTNPTDQLVTIGVGSLLRDGSGQLAVSQYTNALQDILLPGEQVPFSIRFNPPEPIESLSIEDNLELFVSGTLAESSVRVPDIKLSQEQRAYVDSGGNFHLIGKVLNEEDSPQDILLIGAIYDQEGNVVDACTQQISPRALESGGVIPYDINCWYVLDDLNENPALRELAVSFDVMVKRQIGIIEEEKAAVPLEIRDLSVESGDGYFQVSGSVKSPLPDDIDSAIVVLTVSNAEDGSLVAVYHDYLDFNTLTFGSEYSLPESISELTPDLEVNIQVYAY